MTTCPPARHRQAADTRTTCSSVLCAAAPPACLGSEQQGHAGWQLAKASVLTCAFASGSSATAGAKFIGNDIVCGDGHPPDAAIGRRRAAEGGAEGDRLRPVR